MSASKRIEAFQARAIAVDAQCDPRTVIRFIEGASVRPMLHARIRTALAAHGLAHLSPEANHGKATAPQDGSGEQG